MLEITDLNYAYANGQYAIRDISLKISRGEKVALVGPNGAGKTTLLLHLNGILHGQGYVKVAGLELNDNNIRNIRAIVGQVFQMPDDQLFSPSVYDDVAYGLIYQGLKRDIIEKRVAEALDLVGMSGGQERSPYQLSLGEKKRVALAAVLAMRPQVLALDEPTAGLDPRGRRGIINLLASLDQTMLAATHDMTLVAELFPRVVVMDGGCIVFDGDTGEALGNRKLLLAHGLLD